MAGVHSSCCWMFRVFADLLVAAVLCGTPAVGLCLLIHWSTPSSTCIAHMGFIAISAHEAGPPQGLLDSDVWDLVQERGPLCEGSMELVGVPKLREPPFGGGASDTRAVCKAHCGLRCHIAQRLALNVFKWPQMTRNLAFRNPN